MTVGPILELAFEARHDRERLSTLLESVLNTMRTGRWWTLRELQETVGHSEAGISARIRELRKMGWTMDRRRRPSVEASRGLFEYKLADGRFRTLERG
jgi:biotin operon repressor